MKAIISRFGILIITGVIFISSQSCAVLGLTVGAVLDKHDDKDYATPILEGKGWIKPNDTKYIISLQLTNSQEIRGKYEGVESLIRDETTMDLVLIKVKGSVKKIPEEKIDYTAIYFTKKSRAKTGFIVGLSIDVLTTIAFIAVGDFDPVGGLNLKLN